MLDLDKNQPAMVLDLTKQMPELKKLRGTLGWDPHPLFANSVTQGYDLDIFLIATNAQGKVASTADVIYFNNKHHASGALSVPQDNQTGEGEGEDEFFLAELDKIPANIAQVHVYVFIHQAATRGQNFGMVANTRFDLVNEDTGETAVRYQVTQEFSNETALHVATIARNANGWEIQPQGVGGTFDPNEVLLAYV